MSKDTILGKAATLGSFVYPEERDARMSYSSPAMPPEVEVIIRTKSGREVILNGYIQQVTSQFHEDPVFTVTIVGN